MKRVYPVIKSLLCCGYEINFHSFIYDKGRVLLAFIICAMLTGTIIPVQAQTPAKSTAEYQPAKQGTYQLIFNNRNQDKEIILDAHELLVIEKLRKDNEVVYAAATYSDDIRVKILPRNVINRADFKPVPLKYYKDEESYEEYHNIRYIELQ